MTPDITPHALDLKREELAKLYQKKEKWFDHAREINICGRLERVAKLLGEYRQIGPLKQDRPGDDNAIPFQHTYTRDDLEISCRYPCTGTYLDEGRQVIAKYMGKTVFDLAQKLHLPGPGKKAGEWWVVFDTLETEANEVEAKLKQQKRSAEFAELETEIEQLKTLGITEQVTLQDR